MKNCTLIGINAGADLPDDAEGIVIIGDEIRNVDAQPPSGQTYSYVVPLAPDGGAKLVIGPTVFGKPCNLAEILIEQLNANSPRRI